MDQTGTVVLTRAKVVDGAVAMLREQGLAGLSMRRLAQDLGVKHGALYYHVPSKQDLLVAIAVGILEARPIATDDARRAAHDIREALLAVRDGAEVVSFALAFRPDLLEPFGRLDGLFDLPSREAGWAARTLVRYVLGFVAEEQNHAELVGSSIVESGPTDSDEAFAFGVESFVRGLALTGQREAGSDA